MLASQYQASPTGPTAGQSSEDDMPLSQHPVLRLRANLPRQPGPRSAPSAKHTLPQPAAGRQHRRVFTNDSSSGDELPLTARMAASAKPNPAMHPGTSAKHRTVPLHGQSALQAARAAQLLQSSKQPRNTATPHPVDSHAQPSAAVTGDAAAFEGPRVARKSASQDTASGPRKRSARVSNDGSGAGLTQEEKALRRKAKMATGQSPEMPARVRRRHSDAGTRSASDQKGRGSRPGSAGMPSTIKGEPPGLDQEVTSPAKTPIIIISDSDE